MPKNHRSGSKTPLFEDKLTKNYRSSSQTALFEDELPKIILHTFF